MPVRFHCHACQTKLTVSRRYAGQRGRCPHCGTRVQVPRITVDAPAADDSAGNHDPEIHPQSEETSTEDSETGLPERPSGRRRDSDLNVLTEAIAVPRWVVYVQAALLGIVATTFFVFGLAVGTSTGTFARPELANTSVSVSGTVLFRHNGNEEVDTGAVVLLLPVDGRPNPRPEPDTLIPDQFVPLDNPAIDTIREMGGAVVRVNRAGQFQTRLRAGRSYWLLVLSRNVPSVPAAIDKQLRADLGSYFFPVETLLGGNAFHWQKIRLAGDDYRIATIVF